ncbi:MAG: flagellar protein FlgN [Gammaproteobacteria bacterium]
MSRNFAQQCREDLMQLFSQQSTQLLSLNAYLVDIKDRIADNNVEALNDALQQEILPAGELDDLERQRQRLLSAYGFEGAENGIEKCIAWCDLDHQVKNRYQQLGEALLQLQHSLQINDLLVNKGKNRIRRALHMLTGQSNLQNTVIYTKGGEARDSAENRSIARV